MNYEQLLTVLSPTGIPFACHHWEDVPPPPYASISMSGPTIFRQMASCTSACPTTSWSSISHSGIRSRRAKWKTPLPAPGSTGARDRRGSKIYVCSKSITNLRCEK